MDTDTAETTTGIVTTEEGLILARIQKGDTDIHTTTTTMNSPEAEIKDIITIDPAAEVQTKEMTKNGNSSKPNRR